MPKPDAHSLIYRWGGLFGYRIVVMIAVFLVIMVLAIAYAAQSSRRETRAVADAERLTQALATGLADQVSRTLDTVGVVLTDVLARSHRGEVPALSPDMGSLVQDMPQLRAVLVLNGQGEILQSVPPVLAGRQFGDSDWFNELRRLSITVAFSF